jgi:hypothetical protein
MSTRWIVSALALCLLSGCAVPVRTPSTPAFDPTAGPILIYLDAPPPDARRLKANLAAIDAIREDGGRVPLRVEDPALGGNAPQRAHRLASGPLPPGRYTGLDVTMSEAIMASTEGEAALSLPDGPTRVPLPFTVAAGLGTVVDLDLDLKSALGDGFRFVPAFSAKIPTAIPVGLLGLASLPDEGLVVSYDRRSGRVTGVTPVGRRPVGITIDEARRRAFVALSDDDALVAIDLERGAVVDRRPLRGGDRPVDLALIGGGRTLVVANEGSSSVAFVESTGLAETGRALVGDSPTALLVDRTGQRIFVACRRDNRVDEIDFDPERQEWRVVRSAATDPGPFRLQFNRSGNRLYVAQEASPYLLALDAENLAVAKRPFVGPGQSAIRVDPTSDRIYLARRGTGTIEIFDPFSLLAIERLPLPGDASYLTIDRETAGIVAVIPGLGEVVRVSPIARKVEASVPAGIGVAFVSLFGEP